MNTKSLLSSIRANCGITYSTTTGDFPSMGFAVSIPGHEQRLDYLTEEALQRYLDANQSALQRPGNYLGAWFNGDEWYLDVSHVVDDENEACRLGAQYGQQAIFSLEHKLPLWVPTYLQYQPDATPIPSGIVN